MDSMAAKWESQKKGFLDDSAWMDRAKAITGEKIDDSEPGNSRVMEQGKCSENLKFCPFLDLMG